MNLGKYIQMSEEEKKRWDEEIKMQSLEMPIPEMRLYGVDENYFETMEELVQYCQKNGISTDKISVLEYFRTMADRSDVIRKTYPDGICLVLTAVDEDGYGIYNHERSIRTKEWIWEYSHGSIEEYYIPFQEKGITFEEDVYGKIHERNRQIQKAIKEHNYFCAGKTYQENQ